MSPWGNSASKLSELEKRLGAEWPALRKAREDSLKKRQELATHFSTTNSPDTSLVVFGSVARQEVTSSSDLDWILLVDGQSIPEHKVQEREVERRLASGKFVKPGKSGVFGRMVGSHDLVHNIGGEDDFNSNTTRRVRMLLESLPVGNDETYLRVRRQILRRYLEDDRGLLCGGGKFRVPRFLLNDITRYWRTVTVDFVYKQRAHDDKKWTLRNAKLRMSRKLLFATGLLRCFSCHLDISAEVARKALQVSSPDASALTEYMERQLALTPLEVVAKTCLEHNINPETARSLFDNYDRFLAILDDKHKRDELGNAESNEDLSNSPVWTEVREVSRQFHDGLVALFLSDNEDLKTLTMEYGVF